MRNKTTRDPLSLPCWPWGRGKSSDGYGGVSSADGFKPAHRFVYEALVGPIPDGLQLDHLCRNRGCVNPDHLEPVTPAENVRRGAACSPGKLSHGAAADIRESHANGVAMRFLATRYGVSCEAIRQVVKGITWKPE